MKAAVLHQKNGIFDIADDIEVAVPIGREVRIDVKAAGLCHSDLHFAENDFGDPLPAVYGHELAGVVSDIGPDVQDFAAGDHVVGTLLQYCGVCSVCRSGQTFLCADKGVLARTPGQGFRLSRGGEQVHAMWDTASFAETALVHEFQLAKVPDELPFPQAALLGCGTVTGAGAALNTADVRFGDTVAVVGTGGVGLNVISGALIGGAIRIIAIDVEDSKLKLAERFGATDVINASEVDPVAAVLELTSGGVDHAFEVVGSVETTQQTLQMAAPGGGAYLIGVHQPGTTTPIDATMGLIGTQKKIQGVYFGSTNIKKDIPLYARLYLQGRLNLDDLVSNEINISEINRAYKSLEEGNVARTVITSF